MDSHYQSRRDKESAATAPRICPTCGSTFTNTSICPNDGTLLTNPDSSSKELVKQYEINSVIASGGMGILYEARHIALNQKVAIKMLRTDQLDSKKVDRFKQEAAALSSLDHDNIVKVRDFGMTEHSQPYMVLDFIEGKSLADLLKQQGYLRTDAAVRLASQIADALEHAHSKGIIHRDLKPSNIMVSINQDRSLHAEIIDFGIARILQDGQESALTRTGEILGSPQYMSPEQVNGDKLDTRSDIYSLGCVIFEMLTGRPPFIGASSIDVATQHLNGTPPTLAESSVTAFSQALEDVVAKCLQKDRSKRFQSMQELRGQLNILFEKTERATQLKSQGSKHTEIVQRQIAIGSLLGIIALCAGLLLFQQHQKEQAENVRLKQKAQANYEKVEVLQQNSSNGANDLVRKNIKKTIALSQPGLMNVFGTEEFCTDEALDAFGYGKAYIVGASFDRTNIKGPGLAYLIRHPLFILSLNESAVTDRAGLEIRRMPHLAELQVDNCSIGSAFFKMLSKTKLRRLSARIDKVSDSDMESIAAIKSLIHLQLAKNNMTSKGYEKLLSLPHLEKLELQDNPVDMKSAEIFSKLKNLEEINVGASGLNDEQLAVICKAPKLHVLTLFNADITKKGLNTIGKMKRLSLLNVSDLPQFSDDDFKFLEKFPIEQLYIAHTGVTNKFLDYLNSKKLVYLDIARTKIDDEGLRKLDKFPALRELDFEFGQFSKNALSEFERVHPNIKLHQKQKATAAADYFNDK